MRSLVRTIRFVITDTFKSRKGAVEVPGRREFYRDATGPRGGLDGDAGAIRRHTDEGLRPDAR